MKSSLPFDTSTYNDLPLMTFIYKVIQDDKNNICDYRIVYGNKIFLGASISGDNVFNDKVLSMMKKFFTEEPQEFSTYLLNKNLYVHFQPILNLPKPFGGFFLVNVSGYEETTAKLHFLNSIRQMRVAGILLHEKIDGSLECVYVSKECCAGKSPKTAKIISLSGKSPPKIMKFGAKFFTRSSRNLAKIIFIALILM